MENGKKNAISLCNRSLVCNNKGSTLFPILLITIIVFYVVLNYFKLSSNFEVIKDQNQSYLCLRHTKERFEKINTYVKSHNQLLKLNSAAILAARTQPPLQLSLRAVRKALIKKANIYLMAEYQNLYLNKNCKSRLSRIIHLPFKNYMGTPKRAISQEIVRSKNWKFILKSKYIFIFGNYKKTRRPKWNFLDQSTKKDKIFLSSVW